MEGTHCYNPSTDCDTTGLSLPVFEYSHSVGNSITGGYVYRGPRIPNLAGTYIYGDYVDRQIWGLQYENGEVTGNTLLAESPALISSFGEAEDGELYVVGYNGFLYTFEEADTTNTPGNIPDTLSNSGLYTDMDNQTVAPGIIPYGVISRLWSDGAYKTRYLALPGTSQIDFNTNQPWQFPPNAVLVKNFYLEMEHGNPESRKIIETRFLVHRSSGNQWDGFSYEWNDEATEAYLLSGSDTKTFTILDSSAEGGSYEQTYYYPSRNDCKTCHTPAAGHVLGVRTAELNGEYPYENATDNQLRSLNHINVFTEDIGEDYSNFPQLSNPLDETQDLADRARSYLDANCAQCHRPGGPGRTNMDLRFQTSIQNTQLIHIPPTLSDLGVNGAERITPGYPDSSVLYLRMTTLGQHRMPPLATSVVDEDGTDVIRQWIEDMAIWKIRISADNGVQTDADNYLGTAPDATTVFDSAYDEVEPPAPPGDYVQVYFPHPEWNNPLGDNFSSDFLPQIGLTDTMEVWNFNVRSSVAGQVTLTFDYVNLSSLPVIFGNSVTGTHYALSDSGTVTFSAQADSIYSFSVSVGDTTAPQLTLDETVNGPQILRAGEQKMLQWSASDGDRIDSTKIWYSDDGGSSWQPLVELGNSTMYDWILPSLMLNIEGKIRIGVFDYAGNQNTQTSTDYFAIVGDSLSTNVSAGWNLWGAPVIPAQDSMHLNLGDDFAGYWVTYDYVNNGYTFNGILSPTAGYWLGTVNSSTVDVQGTPVVEDTTVSLTPGWNLISDPIVLTIQRDSLMFHSDGENLGWDDAQNAGWVNTIYGYQSGGYTTVSTLEPWQGYWLSVIDSNLTVTYPIHQYQMIERPREPENIVENGWAIAFFATTGEVFDSTTVIGAADGASSGFDNQFDAVKPPLPPGENYVSLDLAHPDWDHPLGDYFARDIRSTIAEGESKTWQITSRTTSPSMDIHWEKFNFPDANHVAYKLSEQAPLQSLDAIDHLEMSASDTLWIQVGRNVLGTERDSHIPTSYALEQNYPNPFNPSTTIRFALPKDSPVKITVYNMTGQVVDILLDRTIEAGYHTVKWSASDMSSGLYLYQIEAGNFQQTRKCIILK